MKTVKLLLTISLVLVFSTTCFAKNDQTVVLGASLGGHQFSDLDDLRKDDEAYSRPGVETSWVYRLFAEWFVLGNFGIGLQTNYQLAQRTFSSGNNDYTHTWAIRHFFGTINVVPFGGESYARMGLYVGGGPSVYSLHAEMSGPSQDDEETYLVDGTASTAGIYIDWGGEAFGSRFGYQFISASYPDLEIDNIEHEVSSSGGTVHLDLRWAF